MSNSASEATKGIQYLNVLSMASCHIDQLSGVRFGTESHLVDEHMNLSILC